jgi:Holliday junction resolvase RusA-like endonuclease
LDDNDRELREWRHTVTITASAAMRLQGLTTFDEPVAVEAGFYFVRPKGHYGTGKNADILKDSAPSWPAVKPDVDKLLRALLDACTTAAVWFDDSRVVSVRTFKAYTSGMPGITVRVRPMLAEAS